MRFFGQMQKFTQNRRKTFRVSFASSFCAGFVIFILLFSIFYFVFSDRVFAETTTQTINLSCEKNPDAYPWCREAKGGLGPLVGRFYQIALGLAGAAALGVLIYGAILWTVSGAVTGKQDALEWIKGALWGLVLLLGAYLILWTINPDLVNLTNPPATFLTVPTTSTTSTISTTSKSEPYTIAELAELADDARTRKYLADKSIFANKEPCKNYSDTNCTMLSNLPQNAVDGLINLKNECKKSCSALTTYCGCDFLTITGGTEAGHAEHGPNLSVVDLRLQRAGDPSSLNTSLLVYMHDKVGLKSGVFSKEPMEYNKRYTAADGGFTVIREKNNDGSEHFHVVFK